MNLPEPEPPQHLWSTEQVFSTKQLTISTFQLKSVLHHVPGSITEPAWVVTHPDGEVAKP